MTALKLGLIRQWFDAIAAGTKKIEYREIKPYWTTRIVGRTYDEIHFRNGYATDAPFMRVQYLGYDTLGGRYRLHLGDILEITNYQCDVMNSAEKERKMEKKWKRRSKDSTELILIDPGSFESKQFEKLLHHFDIVSSGYHPSPQALINKLRDTIDSHIVKRDTYGRLLRWCITEKNIPIDIRTAAEKAWHFLFGSRIPKWRQWDNYQNKYIIDMNELEQWTNSVAIVESPV